MSGALNIFKTVLSNVTSSGGSVYSTPLGYSTVVLMAQISNINLANNITASASVVRSGAYTALVQNTAIPVADAINVLTGRLVMSYGDSLDVSASEDDSAQLTLSLLETLTG